ncbi:MAG TPA: hypothetical protein VF898_00605 [Chloroflexota bacterium]
MAESGVQLVSGRDYPWTGHAGPHPVGIQCRATYGSLAIEIRTITGDAMQEGIKLACDLCMIPDNSMNRL